MEDFGLLGFVNLSLSFTIIFRYQVEKQVLGKINGNSASWNFECDTSKVSSFLFPFGLVFDVV